jgi:hypothetical protein
MSLIKYINNINIFHLRSGFCSNNNGEFLIWSQNVLTDFINYCEVCKNTNEEFLTNDLDSDHNKSHAKKGNNYHSEASTAKCETCDNCNDLLEQIFSCLFGYREKSAAKYLKNHSVKSLPITLENSAILYNYYKPKLPEYDDVSKHSISIEVF